MKKRIEIELLDGKPCTTKYVLRFFKWFCKAELHPFIEGDLLELYNERVEELGKKKADLHFAWDVLLLFRPGIMQPIKYLSLIKLDMFRHNFLISWRGFIRNKGTFLINLIGLSTGLAFSHLLQIK